MHRLTLSERAYPVFGSGKRGASAGPWWRTSEAQRHSTSISRGILHPSKPSSSSPSTTTLNSGAEHKQHPSCHPYLAWSIGIASSRGMPKVSRLPGPEPARHSMPSWSLDPRHSSNPYSYATAPSTRYTKSPAFARASLAGTVLPVALSRLR